MVTTITGSPLKARSKTCLDFYVGNMVYSAEYIFAELPPSGGFDGVLGWPFSCAHPNVFGSFLHVFEFVKHILTNSKTLFNTICVCRFRMVPSRFRYILMQVIWSLLAFYCKVENLWNFSAECCTPAKKIQHHPKGVLGCRPNLKNFWHYLLGSKFDPFTNHKPLLWLRQQKCEGMLGQWSIELQEYNFNIYRIRVLTMCWWMLPRVNWCAQSVVTQFSVTRIV